MLKVYRNNLSDCNRYLYHYTTNEVALKHILSNEEMRLSPLLRTNDPKETKEWQFSYRMDRHNKDIDENLKIFAVIERLQERCKVICLTQDNQRKLNGGILNTLNRGFSHPRMWAQYSGNHTGVCLIFEKDKFAQQIYEQLSYRGDIYEGAVNYLYKVGNGEAFTFKYSLIKKMGVNKFVQNHIKKYYKKFLFQKLKDWSSEDEYRWVLLGPSSDYEYFCFSDSLVGIVLGTDFPEELIGEIEYFCAQYNIEAVQIDWHNGYPLLLTI